MRRRRRRRRRRRTRRRRKRSRRRRRRRGRRRRRRREEEEQEEEAEEGEEEEVEEEQEEEEEEEEEVEEQVHSSDCQIFVVETFVACRHPHVSDYPVKSVGPYQVPMISSVRPGFHPGALLGTGYISAVSMKLTPRPTA